MSKFTKAIREKLDKNQQSVHKKFPNSHWLNSEINATQFFMWNTFFRRNPQIFIREYLKIEMHWYQSILIYLMFISDFIVMIASRASAKSFVIAIYAVTRAILYPNSKIILTSGTRGQSRLIVSEKIQQELWEKSSMLRREIRDIKVQQNEVKVVFKNGSTIETVTCSDNALGHRSTVNVGEEAKTIDKSILDRVVSPFRIVRQVDFMKLADYKDDAQFKEEPSEILISSTIEETHWLYTQAKNANDGMLKNDGSFFIAFDYAISLKHGIRTRKQMVLERKKQDPTTWLVEYENAVLRSNTKAYFTYDIIKGCQTLKKPFYPRRHEDVILNKKNKYDIGKQNGEIRIISCDIATIDRSANDNSVYSCLRLFPEVANEDKNATFKVQVPYLEAYRGREIKKQAIRIRQLYEDFNADYIVLDLRNAGIAIYDALARVLYDDERCCEYPPLKCMNDTAIANRINCPNAIENIFVISAGAKLNSDIAVNLRSMLIEHEIDFLVPKDEGLLEIQKYNPSYLSITDPEERLYYEKPYLETMALVSELINLQYEKAENTGIIKIRETSRGLKDRYTSVSYGCYFVAQLARDLLNQPEELTLSQATICVSAL